jgi:hypothetical protein
VLVVQERPTHTPDRVLFVLEVAVAAQLSQAARVVQAAVAQAH